MCLTEAEERRFFELEDIMMRAAAGEGRSLTDEERQERAKLFKKIIGAAKEMD